MIRSISALLAGLIASASLFSTSTWTAFVTCADDNTLVPISVPSDEVGTPIPLGDGFHPIAVAITPDGERAIVASGNTHNVAVIDLTQPSSEPVLVKVGVITDSVVITPDGRRALVLSNSDNSIKVLALSQSSVVLEKTIIVGDDPQRVAITPDGTRALVSSASNQGVTVLTIGESVEYGYFVSLENSPFDIAISPDGTQALISFQNSH